MAKYKRSYKDSVFVDLLKAKERLLSLYNVLHSTKLCDK